MIVRFSCSDLSMRQQVSRCNKRNEVRDLLCCTSYQAKHPAALMGNWCRVDVHDVSARLLRNDWNLGGRENHP